MMTTSVMSAGDGYRYYTESVATADVQRAPGTPVTDYYTVDGNPPGVWMGRGAELLDLNGQVTEAQMRALYGEGIHPNADAITTELQAAGASIAEIEKAIKLGRGYYKYDAKDTSLREAIDKATAEFQRLNDRRPDRDERRQIRMNEGAIAFRDVHGRQPLDNEELAKYVTNAMKPAQHAMAGIDHTFSVPKSVSVLWALGSRQTAADIEGAHERAIARTLQLLEDEALATRAGVNGVRQIDVKGGVIASRFRHFESRVGDPHLHDHVVISAKVMGADGTWRSLDSKLLLRSTVFLSETYNKLLHDELDQLGYRSTARTVTDGKPPVMELDAVDPRLMDLFSKRSKGIKPVVDRLVKEYTEENGRTPDRVALRKITEQAWQETRPKKDTARSSTESRHDWSREAQATELGGAVYGLVQYRPATIVDRFIDPHKAPIDVHDAATDIMRNVETARSTWGENHVKAEIERYLSQYRYRRFTRTDAGVPQTIDRAEVEAFLLRTALQLDSIRVTPDHVHGRFEPLTRQADGESFYTSKGRTLYTSTRPLEAENRLLAAARTTVDGDAPVSEETFTAALADQPNKDAAQVALAREIATSRTRLSLGVGPAGSGKTSRSLRLAATAIHNSGHRMIGLAPSKHAAKVFTDEVRVPAFTIDGFLLAHRTAADNDRDVSARYAVHPGDIVVVDEAAMASTLHLDQVLTIVEAAGGYVRLVGDHAQISAVGAGGAFRYLYREVGAVELENVYRFSDKHERIASLTLRDADPTVDPFAWYKANGRIVAADKERIAELVFADYLADVAAGRETIMGAPTRDYVDQLNARAQAFAIAAGTVYGDQTAQLVDGHQAHVGDRVMARLNRRDLTMNQGRDSVDNGDVFTVQSVHPDGSLTVRHTRHYGTATLPADYVQKHTHLGYAFTAHQEQGNTVGGKNATGQFVEGSSRGIVTARTPRSSAYVLATRGVTSNVLYVEIEPGQHPDDVLDQIARNVDTNLSAHEMIDVESARILDLARLVDEHADVVAQANELRFAAVAARALPDAHALTHSDGWDAVAAGLARAEKLGLDPARVLTDTWHARTFDDADDIGAVMSWRVEHHLDEAVTQGEIEPLPPLGVDTGRYDWAVDRTTRTSPDLPNTWRAHLTDREEYIDERMTQRGVELTIEQPDWTKHLGPVPAGLARRKEWMRLAAEVDLFRARYKIPATEPTAIPERLRGHELGQNLAARVTKLHKSTAISIARGNDQVFDPAQQLTAAETIARRVDEHRPIADAEHAASALQPDRKDQVAKKLEQLRQQLAKNAAASARTRPRDDVDEHPATHHDDPTPTTQRRGPRL